MNKLFNLRFKLKENIHNIIFDKNKKQKDFYIKNRQIWYVHLWVNIWFEEDGKWLDFKRPILVLAKTWNMFFVAPMTTKWKDSNFYHQIPDSCFDKKSRIILSQCKTIDKSRFIEQIWVVDKDTFEITKQKIRTLLWF